MLDKYVSKQIILAQIASDGGKHQRDVLERVVPLLSMENINSNQLTKMIYDYLSDGYDDEKDREETETTIGGLYNGNYDN